MPRVDVPPIEPTQTTSAPKTTQIPVKTGEQQVARSAGTGRFVSPDEAKANPKTTVVESINTKPAKKAGKKRSNAKTKKCPNCRQKPGLKPGTDHELCPTCKGSGKVKA